MTLPATADVVVIGGGIAGVSAAAHLAPHRSVVLVEAEANLAHHTTGRSAAQYLENYGGPVNRALTLGSRAFFEAPPDGTTDAPLLTPRPFLAVGGPDDIEALESHAAEGAALVPSIHLVSGEEAVERCPVLRPDRVVAGVLEPDACDIDVMALHQCFVRLARRAGAELRTAAAVTSLVRAGSGWSVGTTDGEIGTEVVVNASGAWADRVAGLAGVRPVGASPLRRTAFTVSAPGASHEWPLVYVIDETLYFKPEAGGQVLVSPADETPDAAGDARPEELDVALAIDRLNALTTLDVRHVRSSWAGLRTFVADRDPVLGPDDAEPTFVWMVGQGGTGIQTAPASGRLLASLVVDGVVPDDLAALGLGVASVGAGRSTLMRQLAEGRRPA